MLISFLIPSYCLNMVGKELTSHEKKRNTFIHQNFRKERNESFQPIVVFNENYSFFKPDSHQIQHKDDKHLSTTMFEDV